jgi:hypothetical protein
MNGKTHSIRDSGPMKLQCPSLRRFSSESVGKHKGRGAKSCTAKRKRFFAQQQHFIAESIKQLRPSDADYKTSFAKFFQQILRTLAVA